MKKKNCDLISDAIANMADIQALAPYPSKIEGIARNTSMQLQKVWGEECANPEDKPKK